MGTSTFICWTDLHFLFLCAQRTTQLQWSELGGGDIGYVACVAVDKVIKCDGCQTPCWSRSEGRDALPFVCASPSLPLDDTDFLHAPAADCGQAGFTEQGVAAGDDAVLFRVKMNALWILEEQ